MKSTLSPRAGLSYEGIKSSNVRAAVYRLEWAAVYMSLRLVSVM